MRLEDCNLDLKGVSTAPFFRTEAEEEWIQAVDSHAIPQSLFDLYRRANYLSFGSAPSFLADENNLLFSYFSLIVRSVMAALVDSVDQGKEFIDSHAEIYYPGKAIDDPTWTREKSEIADKRARNSFRNLLNSLYIVLDALAELVAIFAPGKISNLSVGRAQFSSVETWLKAPPPLLGLIATPQEKYLDELYKVLHPIIQTVGPESDWLPYLRLLRSKAAHLGQPLFRQIGLPGKDQRYYLFLPREWPYLWEKHIKDAGLEASYEPMPDLLTRTLAHEDIATYAEGARRKVVRVVSEAMAVIGKAYQDFSSFPFNEAALQELGRNSKSFKFEYFSDS